MSREIASGLPKAPREAILAALDGRKMADLACEAGIDAQAAHNRLNAGLRMARARLNARGIRSADDVVGESRSVLAMSPAAAPDRFKSDTQRQSEWMHQNGCSGSFWHAALKKRRGSSRRLRPNGDCITQGLTKRESSERIMHPMKSTESSLPVKKGPHLASPSEFREIVSKQRPRTLKEMHAQA